MLLDMAFAVLLSATKDARKVARMKSAFRKLRDALMKLPLDV